MASRKTILDPNHSLRPMFDPNSWQVLQHYVYALFDPNDGGKPFYIGKGCGNRVFDHIKGAALVDDDDDLMSPKVETIKDITARGTAVIHKILRYGMSREEALKVEATAIDLVNLMQPGTLTNRVSGHGVAEGIIDTDDLQTAVNARPLVSDLPLLVIKIERKWPEMVTARGGSTSAVTQDLIRNVPQPAS